MDYVTEAYPIVVFCKQLENKQRRMMEIMECEILPDGSRRYNSLFRYHYRQPHGGRQVHHFRPPREGW